MAAIVGVTGEVECGTVRSPSHPFTSWRTSPSRIASSRTISHDYGNPAGAGIVDGRLCGVSEPGSRGAVVHYSGGRIAHWRHVWRGAGNYAAPGLGAGLGVRLHDPRDMDHWIAFVLLAAIGGRMVHAGLAAGADDDGSIPLITGWALASVAVATSIDAAAAGVTIAFLRQPVLVTCAVIGTVTFLLSIAGVLLGGALGSVVGKRAELLGGLVLIGLGCKILIEHQFLSGG